MLTSEGSMEYDMLPNCTAIWTFVLQGIVQYLNTISACFQNQRLFGESWLNKRTNPLKFPPAMI